MATGVDEPSVRIPFRVTGGVLIALDGSDLPKLREGTLGDLVVPQSAVIDKDALKFLLGGQSLLLLSKGTSVLFGVGANIPKHLRERTKTPSSVLEQRYSTYVEVTLIQDLRLKLRGTKSPVLCGCKCRIPTLEKDATSLNHAYTLISEQFEPHRIAHVGNVFRCGYYLNGKSWMPLERLRLEKIAEIERARAG